MEDHPAHWKSTLMGERFWKDAEQFNQRIHDSIEADNDLTLHERFPFNLDPEQGARAPRSEEVPKIQHRRRFSMSDALGMNAFSSHNPGSLPTARIFEIRRARSISRGRSPSVASETRRGRSLFRTPFSMGSSRRQESIESVLSMSAPQEPGAPDKPILFFRGGPSWDCLDEKMPALGLDLFWPIKEDDDEERDQMLSLEEIKPLCHFRRLRVLKITGMMQSYQKYIWQAVWLNTNLEELELGMALEPRVRPNYAKNWPLIKGGWKMNRMHYGEPVYYGYLGDGNLDRRIGYGEYLDKTAMEKAKVRAMAMGRTLHRFSLSKLVLTGFVVDADPFLHWFDPKRVRCIEFKDNCIDAGFYLCLPMKKVSILYPHEVHERHMPVRRVTILKELKFIELKGGKKVAETPYRGPQSFKQEIVSQGKSNEPENIDKSKEPETNDKKAGTAGKAKNSKKNKKNKTAGQGAKAESEQHSSDSSDKGESSKKGTSEKDDQSESAITFDSETESLKSFNKVTF